jgi:uncharacterized membrane protein
VGGPFPLWYTGGMDKITDTLKSESGYGLIEVAVFLLILAIALAVLFGGL